MEQIIILAGSFSVFLILFVLSTLHYFLGQNNDLKTSVIVNGTSTDSSISPTQQSTSQNRRKKPKKKRRSSFQVQLINSQDEQLVETKSDDDDQHSVSNNLREISEENLHDDDEDYKDVIDSDCLSTPVVTRVEDEQKPTIPLKQQQQRPKQKTVQNNGTHSNEIPSKPKASVAPVKQTDRIQTKDSFSQAADIDDHQLKSTQTHSSYSSLNQRIRSENKCDFPSTQTSKKKPKKLTKISIDSNSSRTTKDNQSESTEPRESSINNDYSSESDLISETTPHIRHCYPTKTSSKPVESQRNRLDELLKLIDKTSLSDDQVEILLGRIENRTRPNSSHRDEMFSLRKTDELLRTLIDEKNRDHLKTLAIELQNERSRVVELTKANGELEQMIRQLQYQQQTPNDILIQYQQTIGSYQMQIKRVSDDNNQLMHQLHAYSMIPGSINELKQQQQIVEEQIRQMNLRNSILEKEISDGERASKNAAEIYRKVDAQKQDRIEQMIADLAKYKKIDKEIATYRQKNEDLEKNFHSKYDEIRLERDQFEQRLAQLTNESTTKTSDETDEDSSEIDRLKRELIEAQKKHELLKQRNCKINEQLTKLSGESS